LSCATRCRTFRNSGPSSWGGEPTGLEAKKLQKSSSSRPLASVVSAATRRGSCRSRRRCRNRRRGCGARGLRGPRRAKPAVQWVCHGARARPEPERPCPCGAEHGGHPRSSPGRIATNKLSDSMTSRDGLHGGICSPRLRDFANASTVCRVGLNVPDRYNPRGGRDDRSRLSCATPSCSRTSRRRYPGGALPRGSLSSSGRRKWSSARGTRATSCSWSTASVSRWSPSPATGRNRCRSAYLRRRRGDRRAGPAHGLAAERDGPLA